MEVAGRGGGGGGGGSRWPREWRLGDLGWRIYLCIYTLVYLEDRGLEEDCLVYTEEEEGAHCTPGLTLTL